MLFYACDVRIYALLFLLAVVGFVALLLGQVLLDDGATGVTHLGDVVAASVLDGLVEGERDSPRSDVKGAAGHHLVTAVDGDGHNGQTELQREFKGAVLERSHETSVGAASLREHDNRHAAAVQFLLGGCHGVAQTLSGMGVHQDMACHAAGGADDGDVGDALAHHPLEVVPQEAVNREDVIGALVIGDKHITCLMVNMLAPLDLHPYQVKPAPQSGPPLGGEVAEVVLVEEASHDGDQGNEDAHDQHNGRDDAPLVYPVNVYHVISIDRMRIKVYHIAHDADRHPKLVTLSGRLTNKFVCILVV